MGNRVNDIDRFKVQIDNPLNIKEPLAIALQPIATGLDMPLVITHAGDDSGRALHCPAGRRGDNDKLKTS